MAKSDEFEVWVNTAVGSRWYRCLDIRGREVSKLVRGGHTFTLTTFERQLNQDSVEDPRQDLFRNGTFVLRKGSQETNEEEVRSPDALTQAELDTAVQELIYGNLGPAVVLQDITSEVTLNRILEGLVIEGANQDVIGHVKERLAQFRPQVPMREPITEPVFTQPEQEPVFDAPASEVSVATEASAATEEE